MKAGDEVISLQKGIDVRKGRTYIVRGVDEDSISFRDDGNFLRHWPSSLFKLIKEASMKDRIEALTGWDKEADNILEEIWTGLKIWYAITFSHNTAGENSNTSGTIYLHTSGGRYWIDSAAKFEFNTQCEKLQAFKDALLWLAEKSGKLDDKKDKARAEIAELKTRLEKLEEVLND